MPTNPLGVRTNYYALAISICCDCIPETAFEKMGTIIPLEMQVAFTNADLDDANALRAQGVKLKEIAEYYNVKNPSNLSKRTKKRAKQKELIS